MRITGPLCLLLLAAPAVPARAEPPACTATRQGMAACFGEKLCSCRWAPGGSLTGRPAGYHWDCGALRPACGTAPAGPPATETSPLALPPFLPPGRGSRAGFPDPWLTPRSGAAAAPHGTR